jgi:hypothetical protein
MLPAPLQQTDKVMHHVLFVTCRQNKVKEIMTVRPVSDE